MNACYNSAMDIDKALGVIWMFLVATGVIVALLWYSGNIPLENQEQSTIYNTQGTISR
jgi:tryptophan-rich sensory protein